MAYWLLKTEPSAYSWDQLVKDKRTNWSGVRNFQAAANLKAMKKGDRAFFYHSGEGKEIVGVAEIVKEAYPDTTDKSGRFVMVDLVPVEPVKTPVSLATVKATPALKNMPLVRLSRLSVSPVSADEWRIIAKMAGIKA
ncbi:MAG TPA: EVE domain-containing protein [Stellaceae bacterium]|jgi:predicted RNA-binding protein with PUA-like domain|nr:EVE domain-containing protein [Stellaceae bacterium]